MLRIIGVIFGVFALSGIIAMSSGQVPVDVVSVALVAVCLAIAVLCFRRRKKKKAQPEAAQAYSYVSFKVAGTSFERTASAVRRSCGRSRMASRLMVKMATSL